MTIRVDRPEAAGAAYARLRRQRGLPPVKGEASLSRESDGPVRVVCQGIEYTLMLGGSPAPAAR